MDKLFRRLGFLSEKKVIGASLVNCSNRSFPPTNMGWLWTLFNTNPTTITKLDAKYGTS
jgi:hypothetical protein